MVKKSGSDRKRKIEEIRKAEKRKEKRTTVIAITLSVLLGGGLIFAAVRSIGGVDGKDPASIGVAKGQGGCTAVEDRPDKGADHVEGPVQYDEVPPTSGNHNVNPLANRPKFYARADSGSAPVERVVHNLEHGYVVVWYDDKISDEQIGLLRDLAASDDMSPKFIVAPWERGSFDGDKHIAVTAWRAAMRCFEVSGADIKAFFDDFKAHGKNSRAPEPDAP